MGQQVLQHNPDEEMFEASTELMWATLDHLRTSPVPVHTNKRKWFQQALKIVRYQKVRIGCACLAYWAVKYRKHRLKLKLNLLWNNLSKRLSGHILGQRLEENSIRSEFGTKNESIEKV